MSRTAKFTLIAAILISTATVWGVHHLQKKEKEVYLFIDLHT
jgi:hypothetical protein